MKGYVYMLRCSDDRLYTESTNSLDRRLKEHQAGEGANFTKTRLPVELVYVEVFKRIDQAFKREKQIQRWSRAKKEALVQNNKAELHSLAACRNETSSSHYNFTTDE